MATEDFKNNLFNKWIYFFTIVFFITSVYYFLKEKNGNTDIKSDNLVSIYNLVLIKNPQFIEYKKKKKINFYFVGYPKCFRIDGFDYSEEIKDNILNEVKKGDTVSIKIEKQDFSSIKNINPFFANYNFISIHSFTSKGKSYFNLEARNQRAKSDNKFAYIVFAVLGSCFLLFSLILKKKPKTNEKKTNSQLIFNNGDIMPEKEAIESMIKHCEEEVKESGFLIFNRRLIKFQKTRLMESWEKIANIKLPEKISDDNESIVINRKGIVAWTYELEWNEIVATGIKTETIPRHRNTPIIIKHILIGLKNGKILEIKIGNIEKYHDQFGHLIEEYKLEYLKNCSQIQV